MGVVQTFNLAGTRCITMALFNFVFAFSAAWIFVYRKAKETVGSVGIVTHLFNGGATMAVFLIQIHILTELDW
jgi:hypothetical protein